MSIYNKPLITPIFDPINFIKINENLTIEAADKRYCSKSRFNLISGINRFTKLPTCPISQTSDKQAFINLLIGDSIYSQLSTNNIFTSLINTFTGIINVSSIITNNISFPTFDLITELLTFSKKDFINYFTQTNYFKKIICEDIYINDVNIKGTIIDSASLTFSNIFKSLCIFEKLPESTGSYINNNQLINRTIANIYYGQLNTINNWTSSLNNFLSINVENLKISNIPLYTILLNYANLGNSNIFSQINIFNTIKNYGSYLFDDTNLNKLSFNTIFKYIEYFSENSHKFYVSNFNIFNISSTNIICNKKIEINDDIITTSNNGTLIISHSTQANESSIVFPSSSNFNSDYSYIKYLDNNGLSESSRLVIGIENDAQGEISDKICIIAAGGNGSVLINKINSDLNVSLDVNGKIQSNSDIIGDTLRSNKIYTKDLYLNENNIFDILIFFVRSNIVNTYTALQKFTDLEIAGTITKIKTILFGSHYNYIGINDENSYFSYYAGGGHAFYSANESVCSIDINGLSMSNNRPINTDVLNCNTLNCSNINISQTLQTRLYFKISNNNNIISITHESNENILVNYPGTSNKLKRISQGFYSFTMNPNIVLNNNYYVSVSGTFNNNPVGTSMLAFQVSNKSELYANSVMYRSFYLNVTKNNATVLLDIALNGFIDVLVVF